MLCLSLWALRIKKVIRAQATGPMTPENDEIRVAKIELSVDLKNRFFYDYDRERGVRYVFPALPGARAERPSHSHDS